MNVLLDTSAVIAILNKKDKHHEEAIKTLHQERERGDRLLMTNFLLAETYGLINLRLAPRLARRWLKENNTRVERITPTDEMQAEKILLEHEDKTYSYVDATSFVIMERLGIDTAFSFDDHFEQYGWKRLHETR